MHRQQQQHRPLASFASLSTIFPDYAPPKYKPVVPVVPSPSLEKPEVVAAAAPYSPIKKQKIKIKLVSKKTSVVAPSPTKKIKITIKKQPKEQQQQHHFDIAPPSSMFFKPYSDYIAPPLKYCRFFIDNRHCFLRSTDNACIDTIAKKVFGFWNCEIGTNSKLLPVGDDYAFEVWYVKKKKKKISSATTMTMTMVSSMTTMTTMTSKCAQKCEKNRMQIVQDLQDNPSLYFAKKLL